MQKHIVLFLVLILLAACSPKPEDGFFSKESTNTGLTCQNNDASAPQSKSELTLKAIYGEDNRYDWYEAPGQTTQYWAKATLALIPNYNLLSRNGGYEISASSYKNTVNLCDGQPFEYQPSAAFCSGFLVSKDIVITAGHCIRDLSDCQSTNFVFDFAKTSANQESYFVAASSVYQCAEVIKTQTGDHDFAVVRLSQPVLDRTPLNVRRSGSLNRGDQVMLVGHPMGLPSKIADGGFVQSVGSKILASVDAFAGNSGSVILNSATGVAEGILVAGEADFSYKDGCRVEARCGSNCTGEEITPIHDVLSYIPDLIYDNPICSADE